MKRIAFHLNCLEQGGAERVVSTLANKFAAEGYEVYVATEWTGENEFALDSRITRVTVGPKPSDEGKGRLTKIRLRIRYLRDFLKEVQPDVLVAFTHGPNFRALQAAIGLPVPVVISIRINPVGWYDSLIDKLQIRWLFPKAAGCVYQTKEQKEFFRPYLQANSRIIINPVNQKYVDAPDIDYDACDKAVVQSSRLVDFKNQSMLVRAFLKVHEQHPDWVLRLYGPDSHDGTKEQLERMVKEAGAEDYILFLGGSSQLEKDLPHSAIFVLSSDYEGMPNVLLEAMALGMPCIATDCPPGAPSELIRDGENGLLVPVGDEKAMAAAIIRMIEDPGLRRKTGQAARRISEIASTQVIYEQWRDYLEEVTGDWQRRG